MSPDLRATMIEVVLDTNILVSAFRSSLGASYQLLQTLEQQRWRPVISPTLAFEYEAVLKRGVPEMGLTLQDIDDFIEYLRQLQLEYIRRCGLAFGALLRAPPPPRVDRYF